MKEGSTSLTRMRESMYEAYVAEAVAGYAAENVAAGRWEEEGALERSRADFESLLPHGLATPRNHLFEIVDGDGVTVGTVWFAEERRAGNSTAFVYDLVVAPEHRRKGHAARALQELASMVSSMGIDNMSLHVFAHNAGAQALYAGLGFRVTGMNMVKELAQQG